MSFSNKMQDIANNYNFINKNYFLILGLDIKSKQ